MRRAQIRHGLDAEQLRRGRKRKSESGLRDWTEAEDVQLLKVVWSGARGLDRSIPTRGYETCKKRLQLIGKHVDRQWLSLHMGDATLTANVIAVLEDVCVGSVTLTPELATLTQGVIAGWLTLTVVGARCGQNVHSGMNALGDTLALDAERRPLRLMCRGHAHHLCACPRPVGAPVPRLLRAGGCPRVRWTASIPDGGAGAALGARAERPP